MKTMLDMKREHVKNMLTDRQTDIDVVRGVAILLVLWGHAVQYSAIGCFDFFDNVVYKIIYSFHMPLFMVVSGYTFSFSFGNKKLGSLLVKRTQGLLQPIVIGGIIYYYFGIVLLRIFSGNFEGIGSGAWLPTLGSLWFLWSVLSASIVTAIIFKTTNNRLVQFMGVMTGFVFVYLFPNYGNNIYMYPYFVVGFLWGRNKGKVTEKIKIIGCIISVVVFVIMLLFFKKEHLIYISGITNMSINMYRWGIGLFGSITVIFICKILFKKTKENKIISCLSYLGRKSLQIYVLQRLILEVYYAEGYKAIVNNLGKNIMAENMIMYDIVYTPVVTLIMSVIILKLINMLEKAKVGKIVFGR